MLAKVIYLAVFPLLVLVQTVDASAQLTIGTKVYIACSKQEKIKDEIPATYIGYTNKEWWMLFDESGKALTHSDVRPAEFKEWDPERKGWSEEKSGVRMRDRMFQRTDGLILSEIDTGCFWLVADENLRTQFSPTLFETHKKVKNKIKESR